MNIYHQRLIIDWKGPTEPETHGPKIRQTDPRPEGAYWCVMCQCWVLPEQPEPVQVNPAFVKRLADMISQLGTMSGT